MRREIPAGRGLPPSTNPWPEKNDFCQTGTPDRWQQIHRRADVDRPKDMMVGATRRDVGGTRVIVEG